MFDDIIQPKEEFYGGDDNPIEFECEFEVDEDANVSYSFSDLEKVLNIEDSELEKAIDEAMELLFGDDCNCVKPDACNDCNPPVPETHTCDQDCCGCENDEVETDRPSGI